tara:strand:- start:334 stop:2376 length:2043 start_codon:yes stop_codon:yes gene_type:complete
MPDQKLKLNILNFDHPQETIEVGLFKEKAEGLSPIAHYEVPLEIYDLYPELKEEEFEYLYSDFTHRENADYTVTVDLNNSIRFAKHYYTWRIKQHFRGVANITTPNFIKDIELWFKDLENSNKEWTTFRKFALKVNIGRITKFPELSISFEGHSRVYNKSLLDLDVDTELFKWVIYKKEKIKFEERPEEANLDMDQVYPVLNNPLKAALGVNIAYKRVRNKYQRYYNFISEFYSKYLDTPEFRSIIPITSNGFIPVKDFRIGYTSEGSNQLIFGRDQSGIRPFDGLKQYGPNHPSPLSHVRMFFICHEDDAQDSANLLYSHLKNGFKSFRGLKRFVRLPISIKKDEQITFTDKDDPLTEIRQHLTQKTLDPQVSYLAMYIHPRSKEEQTEADRRAFYQVKEELLKFGITSQGVVKNTIADPEAQFSLSNIAVALLAKLDGIPWRLERSTYSELIVGVGAFKPRSAQYRYVGSAFCFSNDGRFQGFECYSENSTKMLAGSIRKAVRTYSSVHPDVKRLVIHFYKNMSNDELKPILKALHDLGLENIPVIVITINKTTSKDIVVFDSKSKDLMPVSGTFINVGRNQFLLCNNTRYSTNSAKIDSFPFPVKISIQADKSVLNDQKTVRNLIDQVYQFSRMYWKSTKQQNLPVTIKYPEMVAEAFPYFKSNRIPEFGENNLWFL